METKIFQYYDRKRDVVCIGTFIQVTDNTVLEKGQIFIVPLDVTGNNGKAGCIEGRPNVSGYELPIVLYVNGITDSHVHAKNHGSWMKHRCYIEIE